MLFSFFMMAQRITRHYAKIWIFIGAIKIAAFRRRCARNDQLLAHSTNTFDGVCQENSDLRFPLSVSRHISSRALILMMAGGSFQPADHGTGCDRRCRFASDSFINFIIRKNKRILYM
jgi:hypothetical protein